jgi:uncharacterized protein YecE (DUF72 family)
MVACDPALEVTGRVQIGCCGWREARARYFEHFPVVELQDPFYEMPAPSLAAKWRAEAPDSFTFCLKAWQLITHTPSSPTYRRLKSQIAPSERALYGSFRPTEQVRLAWERTAEIARTLRAAVVLFQCPASFDPSPVNVRNFRAFFEEIERGESLLAWEPRGSWPPELVAELCAAYHLLHCVDPFAGESVYGRTVYWRLHGRGGYNYVYTDEELGWLAGETARRVAEGRDVYVLFNNLAMAKDARRFEVIFRASLPTLP